MLLLACRDAKAELVHRYDFNEGATGDATGRTIIDSVGGAHGRVVGAGASATDTELVLPGGSSETQAYVDLPNGIISRLTDSTIEAWYTIDTAQSWSRVFDFGSSTLGELTAPGGGSGQGDDFIYFAASRGTDIDSQRASFRNADPSFGSSAAGADLGEISIDAHMDQRLGEQRYVALVFDADGGSEPGLASMTLYLNGRPATSSEGAGDSYARVDVPYQLGNLNDENNWLGRSNWTGDSNFGGRLHEFRIWDHAFSDNDVACSFVLDCQLTDPPNLTFEVDTVSGQVTLNNDDSTSVSIRHYAIVSPAEALDPDGWNSLDDQEGDDPPSEGWVEFDGPSSEAFGEWHPGEGGFLFGGDASLDLGNAFDPTVFGPGNDGDLVVSVGLPGGAFDFANTRIVYVGDTDPLSGDYNEDGVVNAADYVVWRNHLGTSFELPNRDPNQAGQVGASDYQFWVDNFGNTAGVGTSSGASVPEPAAALLLVLAAGGLGGRTWRR